MADVVNARSPELRKLAAQVAAQSVNMSQTSQPATYTPASSIVAGNK